MSGPSQEEYEEYLRLRRIVAERIGQPDNTLSAANLARLVNDNKHIMGDILIKAAPRLSVAILGWGTVAGLTAAFGEFESAEFALAENTEGVSSTGVVSHG